MWSTAGWAPRSDLAAGVVCLIGGLSRRRGSFIPLVFGVALIFTAIGNTILTLWSLHGPPPPPPTIVDFFGLGFLVLSFVGIGMMAREDQERLNPRDLLDGGIAALGAGAVCAAFVLAHIPRQPGESRWGSAFQLAYPIGFVVLVLIVAGAATVAGERSRAAWVALTAAFALLAFGSALGAAVGMTVPAHIVTQIQWPAATLLIAASMWADPGAPDQLAAHKGTVIWIPALACGAAIAVLFAATVMRVDHTATVLATAALVLVMLRGYSELRHEMRARCEMRRACGRPTSGTGRSLTSRLRCAGWPRWSREARPRMRCSRRWQARPSGSSSSTPPRCCAWNRTAW